MLQWIKATQIADQEIKKLNYYQIHKQNRRFTINSQSQTPPPCPPDLKQHQKHRSNPSNPQIPKLPRNSRDPNGKSKDQIQKKSERIFTKSAEWNKFSSSLTQLEKTVRNQSPLRRRGDYQMRRRGNASFISIQT